MTVNDDATSSAKFNQRILQEIGYCGDLLIPTG